MRWNNMDTKSEICEMKSVWNIQVIFAENQVQWVRGGKNQSCSEWPKIDFAFGFLKSDEILKIEIFL